MKLLISFIFIINLTLIFKCEKLSFQTELFKNINENSSENILISPVSLYQSLSLLSNGGNGDTQKEILQLLLPNTIIDSNTLNDLNLNNQKILKIVKENSNLEIANAVLRKVELLNSFINICHNYDAFIDKLKSAEQVNNWCKEHTHGKIPKIINDISSLSLILLNAVYFKNDWKYKFEKSNTRIMNFKNADNSVKQVDMMYQKYEYINYYEDNKIQMIELPYENNDFSMIIILPRENKYSSIYDYLENEETNFTEIIKNFQTEEVHLYLPRFTYEYSIVLNNKLKEMNMINSFSQTNADFSNLNNKKDLYVEEIIQRTFINVTETGTEAAAVTIIENIVGSPMDSTPKIVYEMNVNHSFIYLIKDERIKDSNNNTLFLFIGSCNNLSNQYQNNFKFFNSDIEINSSQNYKNQLKFMIALILIFYF